MTFIKTLLSEVVFHFLLVICFTQRFNLRCTILYKVVVTQLNIVTFSCVQMSSGKKTVHQQGGECGLRHNSTRG